MSRYGTPLRYPGGKQRLAPFIREVLEHNGCIGGHYVEPYAGGAGVAIDLLLRGHVAAVHLNDSCIPIYAFWRAVTLHAEQLCERIVKASLTVAEWKRQREIVRAPAGHSELEVGFATLYLNRCNRSGILSGGLIGGLAQRGRWLMDARFPRNELLRRIEVIASCADAIHVSNLDAETFVTHHVPKLPRRTFVYCDPPYYAKAGRLYLNAYDAEDHARIARVIQTKLRRKWIVSYDAVAPIRRLYQNRRQFVYSLQYHAAEAYKGREIFVFGDSVRVPERSVLGFIDAALRHSRVA